VVNLICDWVVNLSVFSNQDPNASEEYLSTLVKGIDTEIHCITDKLDHFYLPYEF